MDPTSTFTKAVRQYVSARIAEVPGINSALDYEPGPEGLGELPGVTMLWRGPRVVAVATGPIETLRQEWTIRLYVDPRSSWSDAQDRIEELVPAILTTIRDDPRLDVVAGGPAGVELATIENEPTEIGIVGNGDLMWKSMILRVQHEAT